MEDDTPETILNNIVAVLEEHNTIFLSHRENFEHLLKEIGHLKKRVEKLETDDSLESTDAKFVADVNSRLKAISDTLQTKP